jgi:Na+/H+ antiporter NhaD/arsenite permease-like protein
MVMASNIGGTATLIGDPPNIMIGSGANLAFIDFIAHLTIPCALMMLWLEFYTRRYYRGAFAGEVPQRAASDAEPKISDPMLARWMAIIGVGVLVGFVTHHITGMPAALPALVGAAVALLVQDVLYVRRTRSSLRERLHGILAVTERDIEWPTLAFFGFLFIVVGAAVNVGLIATLARGLEWAILSGGAALGLSSNGTLLFAALLVCWVSGVLSAVIDNIPFVAVMIPVIVGLLPSLPGDASVLWWALSLGACLGGNATPVGASANVTTLGLAERDGVRIAFRDYVRYAGPMTVGTLVIASIYLALHVYLGQGGSFMVMAGALLLAAIVRVGVSRASRLSATSRSFHNE